MRFLYYTDNTITTTPWHPVRSGLVIVIERKTDSVPLVTRSTDHGRERGSVCGAGGEFVEDVAERTGEDAFDPSDLLE